MKSSTHELKIYPEYFAAVVTGCKPFEVRKNDRGYKVGDTLILREYCGGYTNRAVEKTITYVLKGGEYGIDKDYVVLGIL